MRLLANHIEHEFVTINEYIEGSRMDCTAEVITLAHMLGVNIVSYNSDQLQYQVYSPGIIDFDAYQEDNSWPSMYIMFVNGNHFNVMLSQKCIVAIDNYVIVIGIQPITYTPQE